jgi:hypothetical protein
MDVINLLTKAAFCNKMKTLIVDNEQNKFHTKKTATFYTILNNLTENINTFVQCHGQSLK